MLEPQLTLDPGTPLLSLTSYLSCLANHHHFVHPPPICTSSADLPKLYLLEVSQYLGPGRVLLYNHTTDKPHLQFMLEEH